VKKESVKLPLVTKNSNIMFCLFKHFMGASGDDLSALWNLLPWEKQKCQLKLLFVTKNSKHLMGTSGDNSSALTEFTPL